RCHRLWAPVSVARRTVCPGAASGEEVTGGLDARPGILASARNCLSDACDHLDDAVRSLSEGDSAETVMANQTLVALLVRVVAAARKPTVAHPVPANAGAHHELPPVDQSDAYLGRVLGELVGRTAVASFLTLDGFARRFVATVNNLATDSASTERWPVRET